MIGYAIGANRNPTRIRLGCVDLSKNPCFIDSNCSLYWVNKNEHKRNCIMYDET